MTFAVDELRHNYVNVICSIQCCDICDRGCLGSCDINFVVI